MRKFRLINGSYGRSFNIGQEYTDSYVQTETGSPVSELVEMYPEDWEELVKPLHKDTDLGMFSAMFVAAKYKNGITSDSYRKSCELSINLAKELIKQLDNERDTI